VRANRLVLRGTVASMARAVDLLEKPGDVVLVVRERLRHIVLCCPCGCGERYPINLDSRVGSAWRLRENADGASLSLFPSIWRESGCRSHYIIRRSRFIFVDWAEWPNSVSGAVSSTLRNRVLGRIAKRSVRVEDVALELEADPWDVADLFNALVHEGVLLEVRGKQRGVFKLR
jgi:hypothetical protein